MEDGWRKFKLEFSILISLGFKAKVGLLRLIGSALHGYGSTCTSNPVIEIKSRKHNQIQEMIKSV
jgi:hypothetical protein